MTTSSSDILEPNAHSRRQTILCWLCFLILAILLTIASLLPSGGAEMLSGWDSLWTPSAQNVLHFPAYALLTASLLIAADRSWRIGWAAALGLIVACLVYGAILEWLQAVAVPGRYGDWADVLWNTTGGAGGCLGWLLFRNMVGRWV